MSDLTAIQRPVAELSILSRTPIPGSPDWVKATDAGVWVSNAGTDRIVRIDPTSGAKDQIAVGRRPCSGLAIGFGSVWAPCCGDGRIARIDMHRREVSARVALQIANSEGALACGATRVWVPTAGGVLSAIDPSSNAVTARVDVGAGAFCAAAGHDSVWVTNTTGNVLLRIDETRGRVVARIDVGPAPHFLAATNDAVWTLNQGDGTVSRVDPVRNRVIATIDIGTPGAGGDIAAGGDAVWTTAIGVPLTGIDPSTNRPFVQFVGRGGDALAVDRGFIWICSFFLQELWKVRTPRPAHP